MNPGVQNIDLILLIFLCRPTLSKILTMDISAVWPQTGMRPLFVRHLHKKDVVLTRRLSKPKMCLLGYVDFQEDRTYHCVYDYVGDSWGYWVPLCHYSLRVERMPKTITCLRHHLLYVPVPM